MKHDFSKDIRQKHKRNAKHTKINGEEEKRKTMLTDGTETMQRREEEKRKHS